MKEIFKTIEEFPNYRISSKGEVYSKVTNKPMFKRIKKDGYVAVRLSKEGKKYDRYIHRLVGLSFIPNPDNKPQINHIDENKQNNSVENLEWATSYENVNHGKRSYKQRVTAGKTVYQYDENYKFIDFYASTREAAEKNNYGFGAIAACCREEKKTYKGYIWSYVNFYEEGRGY